MNDARSAVEALAIVSPSSLRGLSPTPRATYRLQLHKGFTFDDAAAIVPYLARLGVSDVYTSPILKARPGSQHGYDIVDHDKINPELGGEEGFARLSETLEAHGLGLVLDIVPNHAGVGGSDNAWWLSVLEWGELSPFALAFDIDWERLGANRKLILPFLGNSYGAALENGGLELRFAPSEGSFSVWHHEHRFPICPTSYPIILDRALAASEEVESAAEIMAVSEQLRAMSEETAPERRAELPTIAEGLKQRLAETVAAAPRHMEAIGRALALINGTPGLAESFGTLHRLLEAQAYHLAYWRVAASDINYRRFFEVNELAGLRIEEPEIFEATHRTVFRLVAEGRVTGLRIDHVDGLADPEGYLRALRAKVGPDLFIVVEKILEPGEELRRWPIAGTTGYDVLNLIEGVLVDPDGAAALDHLYRRASGIERSYASQLRQAKSDVLQSGLASELEVLVSDLKRIADADRHLRDYTAAAIRRALEEIIARFPVYRSYLDGEAPGPEDRRLVDGAVASAQRHSRLADRSVHEFIAAVLLDTGAATPTGGADPELARRFRRRFQQLTGPVMAKGLEDTLFYRYGRLLALNEVGGDPGHLHVPPSEFHAANAERARKWPHGMVATATHDTKRGEDARGRISALSQVPQAWSETLDAWERLAAPHLVLIEDTAAPDANDRYLMLQALLGAWPMGLLGGDISKTAALAFGDRMETYLVKALREAKTHTSWVNPNEAYEAAAQQLMRRAVDPGGEIFPALVPLARRLAFHGMLNGLARTALKCTLPGLPDIYQGTELWDLSLVDPDNRRPVDFAARERALDGDTATPDLMASWPDGRIKQRLLARLLADRSRAPLLYADGDYRPLEAQGPRARHILAFERREGDDRLIVAVCRLLGASALEAFPPPPGFWDGTTLELPEGSWRDVAAERQIETQGGPCRPDELFAALPVMVVRKAS